MAEIRNESELNIDYTSAQTQSGRNRPQRRRKTKQEIFKERQLPLIIMGIAACFILVFIIGSITRSVQKHKTITAASIAASESIAAEEARLAEEINQILTGAKALAAGYDYDGAIALIDGFSGNIGGYPVLQDAKSAYLQSKAALVPWTDPNGIVNLSFQTLIADTSRAYTHEEYGSSMQRNFISVAEFQKILERLYANNYILVGLKDFIATETSESGQTTYQYKELLLPEGKKPIVLTQTNVNYNLYLVDSDDDMLPDAGGVGIASKMLLTEDGSVTCEMVDAAGNTVTGDYDLVPILDKFVAEHPDFSYCGAKAVLALTGYNGLFGYRTQSEGREKFGEDAYNENVAAVRKLAEALKDSGYELACYTYDNKPYGVFSLSEIQADMSKWSDEVVPILGALDVIVFAQNSDINSGMLYSGEKYEYLKSIGFHYFVGFCSEGSPFTFIAEEYVRQGRLMVTGENLTHNSNWFNAIFDIEDLLDEARS